MSIERQKENCTPEEFPARFESVVGSIDELPTLPRILWEVQAALHERQNGAPEIANVIEQDPSLTGNILKLANSAHFGSSTRFVSVTDAVARIGLREIGKLANTTLMIDTFKGLENTLDYTAFWSHSIQVAEIASILADQNEEASSLLSTEAFMLGLLHDVGKLLLDQYFSEESVLAREYAEQHTCSDAEAEQATLGLEHGEMAAQLLEYWNLQPMLIDAIRYHHRIDECPEEFQPNAVLVCFADKLWHAYNSGELDEAHLQHDSLSLGEIDLDELRTILDGARERANTLLS